ncbi:MAG: hypothetical protein KatS3mg105_4582 [Gemmatales bacterium]|nr:MAG: hypothetical protein KatS3mg105_4582 [Gemmatales bacterium]
MTCYSGRVLLAGLPMLLLTAALDAQTNTSLFDGTSLRGWHYSSGKSAQRFSGKETSDGRFFVSNGILVLADKNKEGKRPSTTLWCDRSVSKNYTLELEFRAAPEAIGYVVLHNRAIPVGDYLRRNENKHLKKFKSDGWNLLQFSVREVAVANGRRLTNQDRLQLTFRNGEAKATLNGKPIDPNGISMYFQLTCRCNGESIAPGSASVPRRGTIGLRSGSGKIEFRNIRLRETP